MQRIWYAVVFAAIFARIGVAADNPKGKTAASASSTPIALLDEAERISRNFAPDDRTSLLLEAAGSAETVNRAKAQSWALQLFAISRTSLEPGHYRQAMEKNALTILARLDPIRSAQMFRQQDLPDVNDFPNEDVRTSAANILFPALLEKKGKVALSRIGELSNWLGSTGQYPYAAVGSLILELDKTDKRAAASFFSSATTYLPRDPGYLNTNRNFTNLIIKVRKVVPQNLLRQALTEDISAIQRTKDLRKGKSHYVVASPAASRSFDSEGPVLVYRLLPVIEQIDPDWAGKLKADFGMAGITTPGLDEPLTVSGASTPPGQEESATDPELQAAINNHRLIQSQQLSGQDPKGAAQLAQQITDPDLRSIALVSAAPAYAKIDASQSNSWVAGAREQLKSMPPGVNRLRLMIALIKVDITNGNREDVRQDIGKAYDLGEELFEEDLKANPGKFSEMADGFDELTDLTDVAGRQPWLASETLDHVRQVRNDVLRARLLVEEAKGMTERNT